MSASLGPQRRRLTTLPYVPGMWLIHSHGEGKDCDLSLGGCRYAPGLWKRLTGWWKR